MNEPARKDSEPAGKADKEESSGFAKRQDGLFYAFDSSRASRLMSPRDHPTSHSDAKCCPRRQFVFRHRGV
jgi:hypothetical protein